jgi:hydrogenase maturation protease
VAEAVQAALPPDSPVDVTEVCVGGLTLMETMLGYDRVILIDALQHGDARPGSVRRMALEDLRAISPTRHSASAHDTDLVTALEMGQQIGLPLPQEIVIYAVGVENVLDFGEQPTPAVAEAIPQVTAAVLAELNLPTADC